MLSPAWAISIIFRNISTPVTTVLRGFSVNPTISTSSPTLTVPRSTLPVATVPRPVMVNTSSIGIRKGLSISRLGVGINWSTASISAQIALQSGHSRELQAWSRAFNADPTTTGTSSPGNSYSLRRSRISSSTSSISSGSSTWSALFINTTIWGTPTWRASKICSRVWGMGPSAADTTRMAPSIWAAPVIMFFT